MADVDLKDKAPGNSLVQEIDSFREVQAKRRLSEVRQSDPEDIRERREAFENMQRVAENVPPNIPIRFHGCHAYDLELIAKSKALKSGVDIAGHSTSFDKSGEISVTTPKNIVETIGDLDVAEALQRTGRKVKRAGYIDILDHEIPLGCTFILAPSSENEARLGENGGNVMNNVELTGDQFVRLLASSEFAERAKGILLLHGLDPSKVIPYSEFGNELPEIVKEMEEKFPFVKSYNKPEARMGFAVNLD